MKKYSIPTTEIVLQSTECCVSFGIEVISNPVVGDVTENNDPGATPVIK